MNAPPTLTLSADSLLSKWGFNDGDAPDHLLDYLDEIGVEYPDLGWHTVLRTLVREHLLPALAANGHRVEVCDVETIHNPIRASTVDGVEIDHHKISPQVELTPEWVVVQWPDIARAWGVETPPASMPSGG